MPFDFAKWLMVGEVPADIHDTSGSDGRPGRFGYSHLPLSISAVFSEHEWAWMTDKGRMHALNDMITPDLEDDFDYD